MTDKKHINAPTFRSGATIRQRVNQKRPSVLCFFPGTHPRALDHPRSEIIVTGGGPEQIGIPEPHSRSLRMTITLYDSCRFLLFNDLQNRFPKLKS